MLLLRQVLLLLIVLLLATVMEWAPHWSMSLVPADVASPHVSEISVLQVQNAVPCPVVVFPASVTGRAMWCLLMEPWRAPPVKTPASFVPVSAPSLPKNSEILVLFPLTEAVYENFLYNFKGSLPFEISQDLGKPIQKQTKTQD